MFHILVTLDLACSCLLKLQNEFGLLQGLTVVPEDEMEVGIAVYLCFSDKSLNSTQA
jgi:hypothetical protein